MEGVNAFEKLLHSPLMYYPQTIRLYRAGPASKLKTMFLDGDSHLPVISMLIAQRVRVALVQALT